jgi:hypothetical protein
VGLPDPHLGELVGVGTQSDAAVSFAPDGIVDRTLHDDGRGYAVGTIRDDARGHSGQLREGIRLSVSPPPWHPEPEQRHALMLADDVEFRSE